MLGQSWFLSYQDTCMIHTKESYVAESVQITKSFVRTQISIVQFTFFVWFVWLTWPDYFFFPPKGG